MNREVHVRICERLGVKFPWASRLIVQAYNIKAAQSEDCTAKKETCLMFRPCVFLA